MTQSTAQEGFWPDWFPDPSHEDLLCETSVTVAEIQRTEVEYQQYRHVFTALVPDEMLDFVLRNPGGIGHEVSTSGPHPVPYRGAWDYVPRFWIDGAGTEAKELEPLVLSWQSANQLVLWPDQGFLMTYGLVPRFVEGAGGGRDIHWDDPSAPRSDIVIARTISTYSFPRHSGASIAIAREYLEDYATIRERALVEVYYIQQAGPLTRQVQAGLDGRRQVEFRLPGRLLDVRISEYREKQEAPVLAQAWGVRLLIRPGEAPVSAGRWEYGSLVWPGIAEPVTHERAMRLHTLDVAYVRDNVLEIYEARPEFSVHPESGGVSHGHQWSVSPTWRLGRDLIAVDLKKLYEGTRPEIVRHWHSHAVPPPADLDALRHELNVGVRARRIVYGFVELGEGLAAVASRIMGWQVTGAEFSGLDRPRLDYEGWWTAEQVEPITRHIPLGLGKEPFLRRSEEIYKFVVEPLAERLLRQTLLAIGMQAHEIRTLGSLRLLELLVRISDVTAQSGLTLGDDAKELLTRLAKQPASKPIDPLFALNGLRQLADHRGGAESRETKFLRSLGSLDIDPLAYASGWGAALDVVYDRIAETLERAATTLASAT